MNRNQLQGLPLAHWCLAMSASCIFISLVTVSQAQEQSGTSGTNESRPFQVIVTTLRQESLEKQYSYFLKLSKGLTPEDFAWIAGDAKLPHFGRLVEELFRQQMLPVLRLLASKAELDPDNHWAITERLSKQYDSETFEILLKLTSRHMSEVLKVSGEDIDGYSVVSFANYLNSEQFRRKTQDHLLKLLKQHGHPSVRAFAAEALKVCSGSEVVEALEKATKDEGAVVTMQGPYGSVAEYARESLESVKRRR